MSTIRGQGGSDKCPGEYKFLFNFNKIMFDILFISLYA